MKYRRLITALLALCVLLSVLPGTAMAANMSASEALIQFIKDSEGFTRYKYWDYQHYSVGYGTQCESWEYPNGITEAQADALLRKYVNTSVNSVNSFVRQHGINPTQQEFDCMVSVTYGLGTVWMQTSYDLPKLMINGCTELELLNSLGGWVTAQGQTLNGLIYKRMRENYIYFHGIYNASSDITKDVPYACVKFDPNGGTVDYKRVYTFRGKPYGMELKLPVPVRSGYEFAGWYDSDGKRITDATIAVDTLMTVTAKWQKPGTVNSLYTDVRSTDWFYQDVKEATEKGLFDGYSDGSFRPKNTMTRAMFAQVLYRIAGIPQASGGLPFTDVPANAWYYDAVQWAYSSGIVNGISETKFAPNHNITREQMATMLCKYARSASVKDYSADVSLEHFQDFSKISAYALEPMCWAVSNGLINGVSEDMLSPGSNATRAQAAAILVRLTEYLKNFMS